MRAKATAPLHRVILRVHTSAVAPAAISSSAAVTAPRTAALCSSVVHVCAHKNQLLVSLLVLVGAASQFDGEKKSPNIGTNYKPRTTLSCI